MLGPDVDVVAGDLGDCEAIDYGAVPAPRTGPVCPPAANRLPALGLDLFRALSGPRVPGSPSDVTFGVPVPEA